MTPSWKNTRSGRVRIWMLLICDINSHHSGQYYMVSYVWLGHRKVTKDPAWWYAEGSPDSLNLLMILWAAGGQILELKQSHVGKSAPLTTGLFSPNSLTSGELSPVLWGSLFPHQPLTTHHYAVNSEANYLRNVLKYAFWAYHNFHSDWLPLQTHLKN